MFLSGLPLTRLRSPPFNNYIKPTLSSRNQKARRREERVKRRAIRFVRLLENQLGSVRVRVAETLEEDKGLVKAGFKYVTERNVVKVYSKRK